MKYLAIDTSGKNLIVIAKNGDKTYIGYDPECGVNHSVTLMPEVEKALKETALDLKDVDFIACTLGAGSFTGIRIGVSTVKALCFAYNKPCLPLTTFDGIAYNRQGKKVFAVIDAKHDHYYACGYDKGGVCFPPQYVDRKTLEQVSKGYKLLSFTEIDGLKTKVVSLVDGIMAYILSCSDKATFDLEALSPVYVRKSQAEEGR